MRPYRFCPVCRRKTYVDGDGEPRCYCGWHAKTKLVLPANAAPLLTRPPQTVVKPQNPISDSNKLLVKT